MKLSETIGDGVKNSRNLHQVDEREKVKEQKYT